MISGLVGGAGLVVGCLVTFVVTSARNAKLQRELATAIVERDAARSALVSANQQLDRERELHQVALAGMRDAFQVAATEALGTVVARQSEQQEAVLQQREAKLDDRLRPLTDALKEYREQVQKMDVDRAESFTTLSQTTQRLIQLQDQSISETERLNRILGRDKERGAWGENQLENIFRLSGMEPFIDYVTQTTVAMSSEERKVRPDAIVRLPSHGNFAIDSKAPLAGYEDFLTAETPESQSIAAKAFAATVRSHVQQLGQKKYAEYIKPSPDFVACFIPSDNVLSTALAGDQDLWNYSVRNKVLLCSPTSLMGMLWSVAFGWRQTQLQENAQEILDLSQTLHERISTTYEHFASLSSSLTATVKHYNKLVNSMESRLLVTIRTMEDKGVKGSSTIKEVMPIMELPHGPTSSKWPAPPELLVGAVDAEVVPDDEQ